jgi:hypothetical protein
VALRIDNNSNNSDSIDKKVAEIQKLSEVSDVSAYGKYIYVVPDLGEPTYIQSLGEFGYNPIAVKSINDVINNKIDKLGIDKNNYSVISTITH